MTEIGSYLSEWVKAEELNGLKNKRTIVYPLAEGELLEKEYQGRVSTKHEIPVRFLGDERKLTLNKTSDREIAKTYGTDDKNWVNKPILIEAMNQIVSGKPTNVIYAKVPTDAEIKEYGEANASSSSKVNRKVTEQEKKDFKLQLDKHIEEEKRNNGISEKVLRAISKFSELDDTGAELNSLYVFFNGQQISKVEVDKAVDQLRKEGSIFEPKSGYLKNVE